MLSPLQTAAVVGFDALRINPLRTVLSTLGVVIGVASLVAVLSLGDGMERTARERLLTTTGVQSLAVTSRTTEDVDGDSFALPDTMPIDTFDLRSIAALPGVSRAALSLQGRAEVRVGSQRRMAQWSAFQGRVPAVTLAAGRWVTERDSAGAVLAHGLASRLFDRAAAGSALGRWIRIGADSLVVVGVAAPSAMTPNAMVIPYRSVGQVVPARGAALPTLAIEAATLEDVARLDSAIQAHLAARTPTWRKQYAVVTYRSRAEQAAQGILIFKLLMGAITGISLLVGGIGIMNVLLASVSERTREIGIRRATGATRRDIRLQFLAESVAISGAGSLSGIVLGLSGAQAITAAIRQFATAAFVQASFSWGSVLAAAAAALVIGLAFGTYPAQRAASLSPIDAIRHE